MPKEKFFKNQSDLTAIKIRAYRKYIQTYLIKILMHFGTCFVADLFCGPGKNGNKNGSPLVLIDEAKNILNSPVLLKRHSNCKIQILFNDTNKNNIINLISELSKIDLPENIVIEKPYNKSFSQILADYKDILANVKIPKFFFLDPFGYSHISINEIKQIMDFQFSEILLFIPTYDAYRFSEGKCDLPQKTKTFLQDFTSKGIYKYKDIHDFNDSIKEKLKDVVGTEYVRSILLDGGQSKHTLFYVTKSLRGMMAMNDVVWKNSDDGRGLKASQEKTPELFPANEIITTIGNENITTFQDKLEQKLITCKMKNTDIIKFTAIEGFLPKHARECLSQLKKSGKINILYLNADNNRGFYVSDKNWDTELSTIEYIGK